MSFCIVWHECYADYRVYDESDPYLDEHPSMYSFIKGGFATEAQAERAIVDDGEIDGVKLCMECNNRPARYSCNYH